MMEGHPEEAIRNYVLAAASRRDGRELRRGVLRPDLDGQSREADVRLLQAGAMGDGGEIFVLDMGDPIRILDLAIAMITLTGLKPFEDMDIVFTGLRPGEKLFEELELSGEEIAKTRRPKIFIGRLMGYPSERVQWALSRLTRLLRDGDPDAIRRFLNAFLPEAQLSVRGEATQQPPRLELPASWRATPEA